MHIFTDPLTPHTPTLEWVIEHVTRHTHMQNVKVFTMKLYLPSSLLNKDFNGSIIIIETLPWLVKWIHWWTFCIVMHKQAAYYSFKGLSSPKKSISHNLSAGIKDWLNIHLGLSQCLVFAVWCIAPKFIMTILLSFLFHWFCDTKIINIIKIIAQSFNHQVKKKTKFAAYF